MLSCYLNVYHPFTNGFKCNQACNMWGKKNLFRLNGSIIGCGALLMILSVLVSLSLFGKPQRNNSDKWHSSNQYSQRIQRYKTIFFDDFDKLDKNVWSFHSQEKPASKGRYKSRFKTNEENVFVDQGCLVLDCAKTADENDGTYRKSNGEEAPVEYLAPYISTCDRLAMSEGRISAKIKVSKGIEDGVFPFCFWTFGQNNFWPCAHEMDIMEASAGVSIEDKVARDGTLIPAGSHLSTFATHLHVRTLKTPDLFKEDFLKLNWALYHQGKYDESIDFISSVDPTRWHIYCVEWDRRSITYYVDDFPIRRYDAKALGAINADGEIGFFYPQDIRFNIKAGEKTSDEHGYMFVDWVKAEALDNIPCQTISYRDVRLSKGDSMYINPIFNIGCTNKAFDIEIEDDGVLKYEKYISDASQMVAHKIIGNNPGKTIVTLHSANGKVVNSFKVMVK